MVIKHYSSVDPGTYSGVPNGVEVREMITDRDGAPRFSLRVFDVQPGASTPFHSHEWEHEVFILKGKGRVKTEGQETPFYQGHSIFIAPRETHCFIADSDTALQFVCVIPSKIQCNL